MTDPLPSDLAQALASLYRAGKIASPWLPGMLTTSDGRVIEVTGDAVRYAGDDEFYVPGLGDQAGLPDPNDPATLGCLLALVREAHGDPSIGIVGDGEKFSVIVCPVGCRPIVHGFDDLTYIGSGPTEAHALLAALRAALPTETP